MEYYFDEDIRKDLILDYFGNTCFNGEPGIYFTNDLFLSDIVFIKNKRKISMPKSSNNMSFPVYDVFDGHRYYENFTLKFKKHRNCEMFLLTRENLKKFNLIDVSNNGFKIDKSFVIFFKNLKEVMNLQDTDIGNYLKDQELANAISRKISLIGVLESKQEKYEKRVNDYLKIFTEECSDGDILFFNQYSAGNQKDPPIIDIDTAKVHQLKMLGLKNNKISKITHIHQTSISKMLKKFKEQVGAGYNYGVKRKSVCGCDVYDEIASLRKKVSSFKGEQKESFMSYIKREINKF